MTTEIEGAPDKVYVQRLCSKWGLNYQIYPERVTAIVLENQTRHFQRLSEEAKDKTKLDAGLIKTLMDTVKLQLPNHPIFKICSVQPMTGPIGIVHWYQTTYQTGDSVEGGIPEVHLDIACQEILAETRRFKSRLFVDPDVVEDLSALWGEETVNLIPVGVETYLDEIAREVSGTMLDRCLDKDALRIDYIGAGTLVEQINRTAHYIHRQTQRAPANKLIAGPEMLKSLEIEIPKDNGGIQDLGVWDGRYRVFCDHFYPADKMLMWYSSDHIPRDTGLIYSPYIMFQFSNVAVSPPDGMCVDLALRCRHKITMIRPDYFRVIER